ncbi:MAG: OstA-like protein [Flavobacteriaceae bacterium]|nr:OstA-like protein [Flavobacteriaceae bacterium]
MSAFAQTRRIEIVHSDNSTIDEEKFPGATILMGNVFVRHEGISLQCTKAIHFTKENYIKAYGNVLLNQEIPSGRPVNTQNTTATTEGFVMGKSGTDRP